MPTRRLIFAGFLVVPVLVLGAVLARNAPADAEVVRLRRHFAAVEQQLLARDVSRLAPAQRTARARHIARLRAYARRGVFPKNTDFPGRSVPYFVDRVGTRCAMAHLIEEVGQGDFVARVAATNNNAYIAELAGEAELVAWLDHNGLTVAEAARIQPAYPGDPCGPGNQQIPCPVEEPANASTGYKIGSGAAIASGLSTLVINASVLRLGMSRRTSGWLGIGAGVLGLALGASKLGDGGDYQWLAPLNAGVGALSVVVGFHALSTPAVKSRGARAKPESAALRAAPWVGAGGAGILVGLRF